MSMKAIFSLTASVLLFFSASASFAYTHITGQNLSEFPKNTLDADFAYEVEVDDFVYRPIQSLESGIIHVTAFVSSSFTGGTLISALYEGNRLCGVSFTPYLEGLSFENEITVPNVSDDSRLLSFIWQGIDNPVPVIAKTSVITGTDKKIAAFSVDGKAAAYIDHGIGEIFIDCNNENAVPEITLSDENAQISPACGTEIDLSAGNVTYTVTGGDGSTATYVVNPMAKYRQYFSQGTETVYTSVNKNDLKEDVFNSDGTWASIGNGCSIAFLTGGGERSGKYMRMTDNSTTVNTYIYLNENILPENIKFRTFPFTFDVRFRLNYNEPGQSAQNPEIKIMASDLYISTRKWMYRFSCNGEYFTFGNSQNSSLFARAESGKWMRFRSYVRALDARIYEIRNFYEDDNGQLVRVNAETFLENPPFIFDFIYNSVYISTHPQSKHILDIDSVNVY